MTDSATDRPERDPGQDDAPPSLLFWLATGLGWALLTALGLVLPVMGRLSQRPNFLLNLFFYALATLVMVGASATLALMICRVRLPSVWWTHRILGQPVNEYEGVFFTGVSIKGVSAETQNAVFSAEERMHRWDIVFGLTTLALIVPHGIAAIVSRLLLNAWYFST